MSIRNTAKAVIIKDGKILLNRCRDIYDIYGESEYYSLPGGGQNPYETMEEAVRRECLEETGYLVRPLRFLALYEEISDNPTYRTGYPDYAHKIYHLFLCELTDAPRSVPTEKDSDQEESCWVPLDSLGRLVVYPEAIAKALPELLDSDRILFLGSEHI